MYLVIGLLIFFVSTSGAQDPDWCPGNAQFQVFPEVPTGLENHGLLVKIKNSEAFQECETTSQHGNETWTTVNSGKNDTNHGLLYWGDKENNECGFLISTVKRNKVGNYRIEILDDNQKKFAQCINVGYKDEAVEPSVTEIAKTAGTSFTISCIGQNDDKTNLIYTKLYNPKGVIAYEGPLDSWMISNIRKDDEGVWKCESLLTNHENIITYQYNLKVLQPSISAEKTETSTNINLRWTIPEYLSTQYDIEKCYIERPNGTLIYLIEGVIYDRYQYYGNGKANLDCGISIPKPLQESEIGRWKLAIPSTSKNSKEHIGGFIDVSKSSKKGLLDLIPGTKYKKIGIISGNDLRIQCSTRASLTYCYVKSPSGKVYNNWEKINDKFIYTGLGLNIGDCEITVPGGMLNESDGGQWMCSMGVENVFQDLQIGIDVEISSKKFLAENSKMESNIGSSAIIMCRSFMGYRLKYCRFNRPDNMGINLIKNNQTIIGKYSYAGRGFEAGECGLRISNIDTQDIGLWKCSASIDNVIITEEHSDLILLQEESGWSMSGFAVGLVVFVICFALIFVGLMLWKRRSQEIARRNLYRENEDRRQSIPESLADQIPRERSSTHSSAEIAYGNNPYVAYRNENFSES